jgi:hypothetical protein
MSKIPSRLRGLIIGAIAASAIVAAAPSTSVAEGEAGASRAPVCTTCSEWDTPVGMSRAFPGIRW